MSLSPKRLFQGDVTIWIVFFLLSIISIVEVFSAASSLSYKTGNFMAPLFKQILFFAVGTAVVWVVHSIPCRYFRILPVCLYPICIALLSLVLMLGSSVNGSQRWLFGFQPSEIAKGTVVLAVALILAQGQTPEGANPRAMRWILGTAGFICILIFPENFSTAVLLFTTVLIMMFIGRVPMRQLLRLVGSLVLAGVLVVLLVAITPKSVLDKVPFLHRMDTWVERINDRFQGGKQESDADYLREHAQVAHANIAIATCNWVGKVPGNSDQRDRLSQAYSDFIYAIIIEEMGIEGAVFVVFLYIVLLVRAGRIASRCERNFPAYLTMGLAIMLVLQALMNVCVAVGLAPVTGQPLPLISRGGSSTLINCVYFGMILSVSRYARKNDKEKRPPRLPADTDPRCKEFQSNEGLN